MSEIKELNEDLIKVKNNFSDNNIDLGPHIFWRYEINKDSSVKQQQFIAPIDHSPSWSNYRNNGYLNIYKLKKN